MNDSVKTEVGIIMGLFALVGLAAACFLCFSVFAFTILVPRIMGPPDGMGPPEGPVTPTLSQMPNELGHPVVHQDVKTTVIEYQFSGAYKDENGYDRKPPEKAKFLWLYISAENVGQVAADAPSESWFEPVYKGTKVSHYTYIYFRPGHPQLEGGRIAPGVRTDGWAVFIVPQDASAGDILVHFDAESTGRAVRFTWQLR